MKRVLWGVSILIAGLVLGGCATTGGTGSLMESLADDDIDHAKVVAVNKWANDKGYGVTWINLPRKPRPLKQND